MNLDNTNSAPPTANGAPVGPTVQAPVVDEFSFGLLMNRTLGGSDKRRPSDKSANEVQVDMILGQAQNLAKMNDQYVETYVVRGTKELYALLGAIYSYALQINESVLKDHILQRMRDRLESEHDVKTQANTPWLTTVLRFILPTDRQTAYTYSKVLQVAHDENLAAQELPNYIKERGGIAKITATKEDAEAAKAVKTHKEAKTQMLRKILLANAKAANTVVQVDDKFVLNTVEEGKKEGTFEFAVCVNPIGQERRVVRFIKLNEAMETQILNMVAEASVSDDLATTQNNLDVLREKLGITSGWGMQPGDKGYQPAGLPALNSAVQPEAMINAPMEVAIAGVTVKEAMF
jgi:Rod binding domain-containing protein